VGGSSTVEPVPTNLKVHTTQPIRDRSDQQHPTTLGTSLNVFEEYGVIFPWNEHANDPRTRDTGVSLGTPAYEKHPMRTLRAPVTQCVPMPCKEVGTGMSLPVLSPPPVPPAVTRERPHDRHRCLLLPTPGPRNDPGPQRAPVCVFLTLNHAMITGWPSTPAPWQKRQR